MTETPLDTAGDDYRAWQEERRKGIGGSDVAAILGLSPWASPYSVWSEKVHGIAEVSEAQQLRFDMGHDAEGFLAMQFARNRPGLAICCEQLRLERPGVDWAFAHVDGIAFDEDTIVAHEFDPPAAAGHGPWDAKTDRSFAVWDEPPAYYVAQLQWSMWLGDYERAWLTCGFAGWNVHTYEIERDDDDIALIVDEATRFWHDHVLAHVAPPVDGSPATSRAIADRWPQHLEAERAPLVESDVVVWATAVADRKAAEAREREAKNRLAAALGDAEFGTVDGLDAVSFKSQARTTTCSSCGRESTSKPFRVLREVTRGRE